MSDKNNIDLSEIADSGLEYTYPMYSSWQICYRLTKLSFAKLWQTSTSMNEFMLRVEKINETRSERGKITDKPHIYTRRANFFREEKDIPMKKLQWESGGEPTDEWAKVRALVEQLA